MKKLVTIVLFISLFSFAAVAQEHMGTPKAEIFGGYQFTHVDGGYNANGWNGALTGNFNNWLGATADFSGTYKNVSGVDVKNYSYTFGPTVSLNHSGKLNPFVHALFGGSHLSASLSGVGSGSTSGFTMMFGGGADAGLSQHFAYRLAQVDWVYYRFSGQSDSKNVRISTGIVMRF